MSLSENGGANGFYMPVAPAYAGGGFGGGFGGDWGWIILLLLFASGGWGNGFGSFGGGAMMGYDFPWLLTGQQNVNTNTNSGFRDAMLNDNITSIRDGVGNLSTQLCNTNFGTQTAMLQGFNQIGSQIANSSSENRLGTADLKYTIATENCADRATLSEGIRDVIENCNRNNQRILDQMCSDKIDAKNEKIADLERQLTMADLRASQAAQTAAIRAGQVEEIDAMYNRLRDCPVPTMPVYGSQPIFSCPGSNGCNCGGNF